MNKGLDLDTRLKLSARRLRAWHWMAAISTRKAEAITILRDEAKFLVQLGLANPADARRIGRLIFDYHQLIEALERMIARSVVQPA